ncbi:lysophospholipase catalytic domain-containing protein [Sordaria sp. MPI-SDFR-AT-0083]|nr:lysophospholipase catalytic domain-containing protein [Sordaria sp. MPI-SDFR-AT-0083]
MHLSSSLLIAAPLLATVSAEPIRIPQRDVSLVSTSQELAIRALPDSPSGGYAPAVVDCPKTKPTLRKALDLSKEEKDWVSTRRKNTIQPMRDLLKRANINGFNAEAFMNEAAKNISQLPNVAIAVSGGGYRALMNGAGFVAAADNRIKDTTGAGGIGGLLQSSTYLAGLSGGGWLVGSLFSNNFSSVESLLSENKVWDFENSIFKGPKEAGISTVNRIQYWSEVAKEVAKKKDAGFETSITDYWGRALSYQLIGDDLGGPAYTFSSIAQTDHFKKADTPFPILVADGRAPGETIISLNATNFEFNPFEMGSWDPTVFGFVPTKYIGANFTNGVIPSGGKCVQGLDQAGFVMGTSSTLFNQFLLANITSYEGVPDILIKAVTSILEDIGESKNDVSQIIPNPFLNWNNKTNPNHDSIELDLVDGGEDLQNIPLNPLIQPVRAVDVIFAVDSSADVTNWPNGTALRATYERTFGAISNGTLFPTIPDDWTFVNLGLNNRPSFFGCDVKNFTFDANFKNQTVPPLIVYVPNAPYTALSNVSTFDPSYTMSQRNDIIGNGWNSATQGNGTLDKEWPTCVACAVISRSLDRLGRQTPAACKTCFERYCWNGTVDSRDTGVYMPQWKIADAHAEDSGAIGKMVNVWSSVVVGVVAAVLLL